MRKLNYKELWELFQGIEVRAYVDLLHIGLESFRVYVSVCGDYRTYQISRMVYDPPAPPTEEVILRSCEIQEARQFMLDLKSNGIESLKPLIEPETVEIQEEEDEYCQPDCWEEDEHWKISPNPEGQLEVSKLEGTDFKFRGIGKICNQYHIPRDSKHNVIPGIFIIPERGRLRIFIDGKYEEGFARMISGYYWV